MDNGQIIEQGTHAELLARQGVITSSSRVCKLLLNDPTCVSFAVMRLVQLSRHSIAFPSPKAHYVSLTACWHWGAILALPPVNGLPAWYFSVVFSRRPHLWWSPDPRAVLWPESLHISRV